MAARKKKVQKPNAEYKLKPTQVKTVKRLLCLDPGSRNMGISCVGIDSKGRIKVIANSILTLPITSLVENINRSIRKFLREIDRWVRLYKPDGFIMERFQSRGLQGPLIELVTFMIAAICTRYADKPCKLLTAATWKNKFHRRFDEKLDAIYKVCATTPHQLDSVLIGCYGLEFGTKADIDYDYTDIVAQTEKTSLLPLRKIRGK